MTVEVSGQQEEVFLSYHVKPKVKLGTSGVTTSTFACQAILPTLVSFFSSSNESCRHGALP